MNKDQVKGIADKMKGKINQTVGRATGNRTQELKGGLQQVKGEARQSWGDVKAGVKKQFHR